MKNINNRGICLAGIASDLGAERCGSGDISKLWHKAHSFLSSQPSVLQDSIYITPSSSRTKNERQLRSPYYIEEICDLSNKVYEFIYPKVSEGYLPLILGGDHSVSIGSLRACSFSTSQKDEKLGLIWIDSHADLNTVETSPSGRVHGMVLAAALGLEPLLQPQMQPSQPNLFGHDVVLLGVQSIDEMEAANIEISGVDIIRLQTMKEQGIHSCIERSLYPLFERCDKLYLSIDLDSILPGEAPGTNTPCESGVTTDDALTLISKVLKTNKVMCMDIVEYNPYQDFESKTFNLVISMIKELTAAYV